MKRLIFITLIIAGLVAWEIAGRTSDSVRFFISSPSLAFDYGLTNAQNILTSTLITTTEALLGFVIAIAFSFAVMFLCLLYPATLKYILPVFVTSQILPIITLAPLFIIVFGMGLMSKIAMVVLMCFFPIFISFSTGVNAIPRTTNELLYIYNAGRMFAIFRVIIPLSTPHIFSGLKVSTTMALMGAIVAEFVGARDGLGKNLYLAPKNSLPELMVCSIALTTLVGLVLFKTTELFEAVIGRWYINEKGS